MLQDHRTDGSLAATRRRLTALGLALSLAALGCGDKKKDGGDEKKDPGAAAMKGYADAVEAHFAKNGNQFIATDVMYFCRSGNQLGDSKLAPLGFAPPDDAKGLSFCYHVSADLKKVALTVGSEAYEQKLCVKLDGSGGKVVRGKPAKASRCEP